MNRTRGKARDLRFAPGTITAVIDYRTRTSINWLAASIILLPVRIQDQLPNTLFKSSVVRFAGFCRIAASSFAM
jgi:hypothetical protein